MPADLSALTADLIAETAWLDEILEALPPAQWQLPTPAPGWTIADQVSHLAYFDEATLLSIRDPDAVPPRRRRPGRAGQRLPRPDRRRVPPPRCRRTAALVPDRPPGSARRLRERRPRRPAALVRPGHGARVVGHGPADGNLGARPGHRRHPRHRAAGHQPAAARRAPRRAQPALQLRGQRPAQAGRPHPGRAHGARRRPVDLGARRRRRPGSRHRARLLPRGHPAAAPHRHRAGDHRPDRRPVDRHRAGLRRGGRARAAAAQWPKERWSKERCGRAARRGASMRPPREAAASPGRPPRTGQPRTGQPSAARSGSPTPPASTATAPPRPGTWSRAVRSTSSPATTWPS